MRPALVSGISLRISSHTVYSNSSMRQLMSELLFDRPFDPMDATNHCQPRLLAAAESMRKDTHVLENVAKIKKAFLTQNDCLCHGDLSPDNILVVPSQFRVRTLPLDQVWSEILTKDINCPHGLK